MYLTTTLIMLHVCVVFCCRSHLEGGGRQAE